MQKRTFAPRLAAGALVISLSLGTSGLSSLWTAESIWAAETNSNHSAKEVFTFDASKGCITAYHGSDPNVRVPETINGTTVTGIGWGAFRNCTTLEEITLPDTITSIASMAFEGCTKLTDIVIPTGVTTIAPYTFYGCSSLINVTLPSGITTIMLEAFGNCSSLTEFTLPEGVVTIESEAFQGCHSLSRITIPASVTEFGEDIFSGCTGTLTIVADKDSVADKFAASAGISCQPPTTSGENQPGTLPDTRPGAPGGDSSGKPNNGSEGSQNGGSGNDANSETGFTNSTGSSGSTDSTNSPSGETSNSGSGHTPTETIQLSLSKTKATLYTKGKRTLTLKLFHQGTVLAGKDVIWKSSNSKVASIQSTGKITAKKKGKTTISATYKDVTVKATITVKKPVLKLNKSKATLTVKKKVKIKAIAIPAKKITYKSINKKIAVVSKNGTVTAKSPGKTKIKVTANGVKKYFTVTVR